MKDLYCMLEREVLPAFGCTEPIALAFAAAKAVEVLGEFPSSLHADCSGNIIKNAKSVTIPNAQGRTGFYYSLILGAIVGDASKELEVLEGLTSDDVKRADELFESNFCTVSLAEGVANLYIAVTAKTANHEVKVTVQQKHTNITHIEKDGEVIFDMPLEQILAEEVQMTFDDCYEFAEQADFKRLKELLHRQFEYNMAIAEEGMKNSYGSNIGKLIIEDSASIADKARAYAAAGSDARMGGCSMPVMINCGSGNQGITLAVPIFVYAEEYDVPEERRYRALALANVLALYIKHDIGRLSAYCGVVSAASATAAGIAYLMAEPKEVVWETLSNALVGTSGVVCDGAKASCAMKIGMSLGNALLSYRQAKSNNSFKNGDGIVKANIDETVQTVGRIARDGMRETDIVILESMIEK